MGHTRKSERRTDIRQLAEFFAAKYGRELRRTTLKLTDESARALEDYDWPGNVRELENCIERACILAHGSEIKPADLNISPPSDYSATEQAALLDGFDLRGSLSEVSGRAQRLVERRKISSTLKECDYNKSSCLYGTPRSGTGCHSPSPQPAPLPASRSSAPCTAPTPTARLLRAVPAPKPE